MLKSYRRLLRLYPSAHRQVFGEEMLGVFLDMWTEVGAKGSFSRARFCVREIVGLVEGAAYEHLRILLNTQSHLSFSIRRFTMRDGFRFPKTTAVLMTIILAGVVLAIQKGESIALSLPHINPQIAPIQPLHSTILPPIIFMLAMFYGAGFLVWAVLFALGRSGVHRLDDVSISQK